MHILFIIFFIFSCSALPLTIYKDARFLPNFSNLFLKNLTQIFSRDECACRCYFDQWCLTATYYGINQQCSLFFAWLEQGQLRLVVSIEQSGVLHFPNKTLPPPSLLTSTNETVIGIWNTTAGSNSLSSSAGNQTGCFYPGEQPSKAFDQLNSTKYSNFGVCNSSLAYIYQCGLNTGLYLTLKRGPSLLSGVRFCAGNDNPPRDPVTITIEGSNQPNSTLIFGSSWSLIYNGSTGLKNVTARQQFGTTQLISNNYIWYNSYRILATTKAGSGNAVQYSEVELLGY